MPSTFVAAGAASYAPEIGALNAAGLPTTFQHTGGGCTALQLRCAPGRHLLITVCAGQPGVEPGRAAGMGGGCLPRRRGGGARVLPHHQRLHHPSTAHARAAHPALGASGAAMNRSDHGVAPHRQVVGDISSEA